MSEHSTASTHEPVARTTEPPIHALQAFGAALARRGRLTEADEWLSTLLMHAPAADTYCLLGKVRAQRNDHEGAAAAFEAALALAPRHPGALAGLSALTALSSRDQTNDGVNWKWVALGTCFVGLLTGLIVGRRSQDPAPTPAAASGVALSREVATLIDGQQRLEAQLATLSHHAPPTPPGIQVATESAIAAYDSVARMIREVPAAPGLDVAPVLTKDQLSAVVTGSVASSYLRHRLDQIEIPPGLALDITGVTVGHQHTVVKGETLRSVAKTLYGNALEWTTLWMDNQSALLTPRQLSVGTKLYVR